MPAVINEPFIFHPKLTVHQLSFKSPRPNERRTLPFAIVPRAIEAQIATPNCVTLKFDYLIDEPIGRTDNTDGSGIVLRFGKFSNKLLSISIEFKDPEDFFRKLKTVHHYIFLNQKRGQKDSVRHYFTVIQRILSQIGRDLRTRDFLKPSLP